MTAATIMLIPKLPIQHPLFDMVTTRIEKTAGARSPEGGCRAGEARLCLQRAAGVPPDDAGGDDVPVSQSAVG